MMIDQEENIDKKGDQRLNCSRRSLYGKLFGHNINMEKDSEMKK
jgi:hypothetical protein